MRLINVHTRLLEEFVGTATPKYAILSHTWEEEEVNYGQYIKGDYEQMKGYYKIDMTCRMAKKEDLSYAWVDTCCIDKSSSAELSEAINSMYRWYEGAKVCYAYLSDLHPGMDWTESLPKCRWFTRGWTLQELIASQHLVFFDSAWDTTIRSRKRTKAHLAGLISEITRIDKLLLSDHRSVRDNLYCVAQKMSWAARRETTRVEDKAYCLLGLFDINMPLLYGEGERAFIRLQEEIMRSKADLSILAWKLPYTKTSHVLNPGSVDADRSSMLAGVLAHSSADFEHAGNIMNVANRQAQEFSTTNVGIKLRTRIYLDTHKRTLILPLQCALNESGYILSIRLLHLGNEHYLRLDPFSVYPYKPEALIVDLPIERYLLPDHFSASGSPKRWVSASKVRVRTRTACLQILPLSHDRHVYDPWPMEWYDLSKQTFFIDNDQLRDMCYVKRWVYLPQDQTRDITLVALGWSEGTVKPQFGIVLNNDHGEHIKQMQDIAHRYHYDRKALLYHLRYNKVPRVMSLHFPLPGTNEVAVVTVHAKRNQSDKRNFRLWCWVVTFSVETYPEKSAPAVQELEWNIKEEPFVEGDEYMYEQGRMFSQVKGVL